MLRHTAREFLDAECPTSLVREMETDPKGYPPALWRKTAELGWQGMALPEKYGGQNLPLVYLGLILQEAGRALVPLPLHSTVVAALTIARDGTDTQREKVLPAVAQGDTVLTWAFTEEDPRFLSATIRTEAVADGDHFVISGRKLFVDNFVAADWCVVACRTAPAFEGAAGLSLFLVDTKSPGLSQIPLVTLAKDRQSEVIFDHVRVPRASLIGELHRGRADHRPHARSSDGPPLRADARRCQEGRGDGHRLCEVPCRVRTAHRGVPVDPAPPRRHDHVDRRRRAPDLRGPVEDGPGVARPASRRPRPRRSATRSARPWFGSRRRCTAASGS